MFTEVSKSTKQHADMNSGNLWPLNKHLPWHGPEHGLTAQLYLKFLLLSRIFTDLILHNYRSNQSAHMTRFRTDLCHQYGIFGGKSQTLFSRNATRAGSKEGRLFSQAISDQATEDTLKAEFRSHFRYRCWTSNVLLLHNSLDYLTITWWRQQNRGFFWDEPTRDRPINRDPRNGDRSLQLFLLHILPLCNVQCMATLEYLCFPNNAGLRFSFNCLK